MIDNNWHKSSYSGSANPDCVECRTDRGRVLVRDTQHRFLGRLSVSASEWRAFMAAVRAEEL